MVSEPVGMPPPLVLTVDLMVPVVWRTLPVMYCVAVTDAVPCGSTNQWQSALVQATE
jgi:hypothetical protein